MVRRGDFFISRRDVTIVRIVLSSARSFIVSSLMFWDVERMMRGCELLWSQELTKCAPDSDWPELTLIHFSSQSNPIHHPPPRSPFPSFSLGDSGCVPRTIMFDIVSCFSSPLTEALELGDWARRRSGQQGIAASRLWSSMQSWTSLRRTTTALSARSFKFNRGDPCLSRCCKVVVVVHLTDEAKAPLSPSEPLSGDLEKISATCKREWTQKAREARSMAHLLQFLHTGVAFK
jgi:hypothetical protein